MVKILPGQFYTSFVLYFDRNVNSLDPQSMHELETGPLIYDNHLHLHCPSVYEEPSFSVRCHLETRELSGIGQAYYCDYLHIFQLPERLLITCSIKHSDLGGFVDREYLFLIHTKYPIPEAKSRAWGLYELIS